MIKDEEKIRKFLESDNPEMVRTDASLLKAMVKK